MGCCEQREVPLDFPDIKAVNPNTSDCAPSEGTVEHPMNEEYKPLVADDAILLTPQGPVTETDVKSAAPPPAEPVVRVMKKPKSFDTEVMMLKDRENYALALIGKADNWEPSLESEHMVVKSMPGTKLAKNHCVAYLYVDFEIDVDFSVVMSTLEDLPKRQAWDKAMTAIEITPIESSEYETCFTRFNLFLVERDFVERRHRHMLDNELRISFLSVRDERYPATATTGETFLGLYRLFKTEKGSTAMVLFNQSDYKLDGIAKNFYDKGRSATSKSWLENFKQAVNDAVTGGK